MQVLWADSQGLSKCQDNHHLLRNLNPLDKQQDNQQEQVHQEEQEVPKQQVQLELISEQTLVQALINNQTPS